MPAKGSRYATIGVDLAKWLEEYMNKYRLSNSDMARRLRVNRGRITQMLDGQMNTTFYVERAVIQCEGGNWLSMQRYATDNDALWWLEDKDALAHMTPEKREQWIAIQRETRRLLKANRLDELQQAILALNGR